MSYQNGANLQRSKIFTVNYENIQHIIQCINLVLLFATLKRCLSFWCMQYQKIVFLKILENTSYASENNYLFTENAC